MSCSAAIAAICPCATVVHPWVIFNPPGQPAIHYRMGDYAAFRHALLRALPGETELSRTVDGLTVPIWRPGAEGDLAVQIMEWWAYVADILTFYNERIATQAWLDVADLPESVNRLIRLLGYRPRPGIGASVTLAARLNATQPVTLPAGFQVQSKPGPGQQPQIFELRDPTTLTAPDLVSAHPLPKTSPLLAADGMTVWLSGKVSGIKPGERLLLVNSGAVTGGTISASSWRAVRSVGFVDDPYGNPVTAVTFTAAPSGLTGDATGFALLRPAQSATPWSSRPTGWNTTVIGASGLDVASVARDLAPGSLALLEVAGTPTDTAVVTTLVSVTKYSEIVWFANGNGPTGPSGSPPPIGIPVLHTHIDFAQTLAGNWDAYSALVTIRYGWGPVGRLVPVLSASQAAFDATTTALATTAAFPAGVDMSVLLRDAAGAGAAAAGTVGTDPTTMTLGSVTAMPPAGLGPTLDVLFDLLTVSRGQTVANEVLGSGDAAVPGLDFKLRKSPVTYFMDPLSLSGDGFSSTVKVWVDQVQWTEVPSFFGQGSNACVFVTSEDEQGSTHVTFGDGVNGARLPTGGNVVASYRTGGGAAVPSPGTLTNVLTPWPGLKSLVNPIAPTGGADPDPPSRVKTLAPRSVLTFGRAISLDDYQVIAAATPGVVQAAAAYGFDPVSQRPGMTVWVSGDSGAVTAVQAAIAAVSDPNRTVTVLPATAIRTVISLTYVRDPRYLDDPVRAALLAALLDPDTGLFGVNAVGIGQAFFDSQIYKTCLDVKGIVAVEDLSVRPGAPIGSFTLISPWFTESPFTDSALFRRANRPPRRGRMPIGAPTPCTDHRHDPGQGNYISVATDGTGVLPTGRVAS